MPGTIVSDVIVMARQQEVITLMDDYGNTTSVNVGAAQVSARASLLAAALQDILANEASWVSFCTTMSIASPSPLTDAQKAQVWDQIQAGTYVAPVLTVPTAAPALAKS